MKDSEFLRHLATQGDVTARAADRLQHIADNIEMGEYQNSDEAAAFRGLMGELWGMYKNRNLLLRKGEAKALQRFVDIHCQ